MKKLALTFILTITSTIALAGHVVHTQVGVNTSTRTAYGAMVDARNSADSTQFIGCQVINSGLPYGLCLARNASGTTGSCTTTDSVHIQQIAGLSNESYLYYQWDASGTCTYIYSQTTSYRHQ